MQIMFDIIRATWDLFLDAAVYVVFGLLVSGMIRVFLNPGAVARHFGRGRFSSVFKAALLGIPVPLCSCGVLPAVVGFKKQGANNGAATAFLISTPESGVDSHRPDLCPSRSGHDRGPSGRGLYQRRGGRSG